MDIPGRVFLDTNVLNFISNWSEVIFERSKPPSHLPTADVDDIIALQGMFLTGERASWQLAVSPKSYAEVVATTNPAHRRALEQLFARHWEYWRNNVDGNEELSDKHAAGFARRIMPSSVLSAIPQRSDRELIAHAIAYDCDAFCTRDRKTILKRRERLKRIPLKFVSPSEWWALVRPYASLWL